MKKSQLFQLRRIHKEKWIRKNITENPVRSQTIAEIQKLLSDKIAENMVIEMENKVKNIVKSERPQSNVFQVRPSTKKQSNLDFPRT